MSVGLFSIAQIFVKGVHKSGFQLSAVSFQLSAFSLTPAVSFSSPADAILRDFYEDAFVGEFGAKSV
jgi:hypothetical protein